MSKRILVLNCGSSSIKFALFDAEESRLGDKALWQGKIDGVTGAGQILEVSGAAPHTLPAGGDQPYHAALGAILARLDQRLEQSGEALAAIAHRVVHGGLKYSAPVPLDAHVLADLRGYIPLAPLHQPFALEAVETLLASRPGLPQVACFDTAFHHTLPVVEQMLPLPYAAWERGLRRYGFHGLSYEYLSHALVVRHGAAAQGRVIAAHLGSGASLCAMQGLSSVATTMGFSALDGLMMGTRCGALDPGALLYLMDIEGLSTHEVGHMLYHESGLLGVSGISADPRVLLEQEARAPRARDALALYVRRIVREIGALCAVLGGLDMLVFTAGIGEHNAEIRSRVCAALGFLGVALDETANRGNAAVISRGTGPIVAVEATNEEWIAARHARGILDMREQLR
ncbi:acetate/propionate family kinase [Pseudoduganella violaceinigra]|uniref:acetate/propionate family kinase n=1 Tax=Pseudoduganella violaceinigra TaxID=246602 RepID=UPI0004237E66|nr:acetate/propionate family kinase [Pseudoduganella violaceinigra]